MNQPYFAVMAASAALMTLWLALRLSRRGLKPWWACIGLLLSLPLGLIAAKLFYILLQGHKVWPSYGWASLLRMEETELSFFGGCVGVMLAMALTARLVKTPVRQFLDVFAPCGALMAAGARFAEKYLTMGMLGVGPYFEKHPVFSRMPFAVTDDWGTSYWAVFMLEMALALAVAAVSALRKKENLIPGLRLERTAFYLCVPQIFCESLRLICLKWGFVRVEQVLCGVAVLGLLLYGCLKTQERSPVKRFWPVLGGLGCIGALVALEFALDRSPLPDQVWYGVMIAVLLVFGLLEHFVTRRRFRQAMKAES